MGLVIGVHMVVVVWQRLLGNSRRRRGRVLCGLVTDRRQLNWSRSGIARGGSSIGAGLRVAAVLGSGRLSSLALALFLSLALGFLLLLSLFPLLADLLKLCGEIICQSTRKY